MEDRAQSVLERREGLLFWASVALAFVSFQLYSCPRLLLLIWSFAAGVVFTYTLFRVIPTAPNFLLHFRRKSLPLRQSSAACPICSQQGCKRHECASNTEFLQPWDGLTVPATVDSALSEFLEEVLERFVYTWQRKLSPGNEAVVDEIRTTIRYAAAALFRRAKKVDIPALVTGKILKAAAAHLHVYMLARDNLPDDASLEDIQKAVLTRYGSHTHKAMRGSTTNLSYIRHLASAAAPFLVSSDHANSKVVRKFLQEVVAANIFVPAMNFVSKPDFINKLLQIIFDPNSHLMPIFGPPSKDVPFLAAFALPRSSTPFGHALHIPLSKMVHSQEFLYPFIQFMKGRDAIHVLQVYLSLDELTSVLDTLDRDSAHEQKMKSLVGQVETLHSSNLDPSAPSHVPLEPGLVEQIASVLSSGETPSEKWDRLKQLQLIHRAHKQLQSLLEEVYCPRFHQSQEFYQIYIKKLESKSYKPAGPSPALSRKRERQRQSRLLGTAPSMEAVDALGLPEASDMDTGRESPVPPDPAPLPSTSSLPPYQVRIIEWETVTDTIKPYTLYHIFTTNESATEGGSKASVTVKRRYKEFVGLDKKLRQFYGDDIGVKLPAKKSVRNMGHAFVESRSKDLEKYLGALIKTPHIQDSKLLTSFLGDTADPALFMPESKMKSMPGKFGLKREKGQLVEEQLQSVARSLLDPAPQSSPEIIAEVTKLVESNREMTERYMQEVAEDESETTRHKWAVSPSLGSPLELKTTMDLLVYIAVKVYKLPVCQLTVLMLIKLLGQSTIEGFLYNFIADKISLMEQEKEVVDLIHLLRNSLFFDNDPPRTPADVAARRGDTLALLLAYPPPLLVRAVGEERMRAGTSLVFQALQCQELNKQLFFTLLDIIVLELFPELTSGEERDQDRRATI